MGELVAPPEAPPAPLEAPPIEWDQGQADDLAEQAIRWLANNYPECAGSPALDVHRDAVHAAAAEEDVAGYEEALRELMRAGRRVALEIRWGSPPVS